MSALFPILIALAQSAIAPGQAGAPVPAPMAPSNPAPGAKGTPSEVVCRHDMVTGSRLPGPQVCRTRAEWADMAAQAREATQQIQNQRSSSH